MCYRKKVKKSLTILEAYKSMQSFLDAYYFRTYSDDIGALLSGLMLLGDDLPADSAAWHDWEEAIEKALNKKVDMKDQNLTILEAYKSMRNFLYAHHLRVSSDDVGDILNSLILLKNNNPADPATWHDWINAVEKALNDKENSCYLFLR